MLLMIIAFALSYICGLFSKHQGNMVWKSVVGGLEGALATPEFSTEITLLLGGSFPATCLLLLRYNLSCKCDSKQGFEATAGQGRV